MCALIVSKEEYHMKCTRILKEEPSVRFAGLINDTGEIVAGGYKQKVEIYLNDLQKKVICLLSYENFKIFV